MHKLLATACFIFLWIAVFSSVAAKAELNVELKETAKTCIHKIYDQIVEHKAAQSVLSELDESALKVDNMGWPYLEYSHASSNGKKFYLLVRGLQEGMGDSHSKFEEYREFVDSFLGVKLVVYVNNISELGEMNIYEMVKEALAFLYPADRGNGWLRLFIVPGKSEFKLHEKVEFDLLLRNEGRLRLKLKKIDEDSVRCFFNGVSWGKDESTVGVGSRAVLEPGQYFRKRFRLNVEKPGELDIHCVYGLRFMGDHPAARIRVNIK